MSNCKVRVRFGRNEVECEGPEEFVRGELPELIRALVELGPAASEPLELERAASDPNEEEGPASSSRFVGSTLSIARRLRVQSGKELLLAAAAHLALVAHQDEFSRAELAAAMKTATGVWRQTYLGNLSVTLKAALKNRELVEVRSDVYALGREKRAELETRLAS